MWYLTGSFKKLIVTLFKMFVETKSSPILFVFEASSKFSVTACLVAQDHILASNISCENKIHVPRFCRLTYNKYIHKDIILYKQ